MEIRASRKQIPTQLLFHSTRAGIFQRKKSSEATLLLSQCTQHVREPLIRVRHSQCLRTLGRGKRGGSSKGEKLPLGIRFALHVPHLSKRFGQAGKRRRIRSSGR
mmetsp:Transcript_1335/g.3431  ORF Transcript_1335/g.3431 Transcript_1335/m.3431 type:complete len:105 (-) Transcript_1335:958-1272(-)